MFNESKDNLNDYQTANPAGTGRTSLGNKGSILQPYSVGNAAANLAVGQTELEVWPAETRSRVDGEVTDNLSDITTKGVDGQGNNYSDVVQASNAIRAKWLSRNPWLKTPGLVRRGEEVMIWRMGDTDQYYWELLGTTNHLRRRDIMLLVISNTPDEDTTELTAANSYFFEFNSVDKHITLITPMNDGEACGYTIQLNTKDGNFSLSDTLGNAIVLASVEELIQLINVSKTTLMLHGPKARLFAQEEISIETKVLKVKAENTTMEGTNFQGSYAQTQWSGSQLNFNYSATTMASEGTMTLSGSSVGIDAPTLQHNGTNVGDTHQHMEQGDGQLVSTPR